MNRNQRPVAARVMVLVYCWTAILCNLAGRDGLAQSAPAEVGNRSNSRPTNEGPRVAHANILLTKPIALVEIDWWDRMLVLHPAQRRILDRFFDQYRAADTEIRERMMPWIMDESAAIPAAGDCTADPPVARRFIALMQEREELERQTQAAELQLFVRVESILAEPQLANLNRVKRLRERVRSQASTYEYPGSRVDLSVILLSMGLWRDFEPSDTSGFESALQQYETKATQLFSQHFQATIKAVIHNSEMVDLLGESPPNADVAAQQAHAAREARWYQELLETTRPCRELGKQLHDLNALYARNLAGYLPSEIADSFTTRFRNAAYPPVYPNPFCAREIVEKASKISSASPDQLATIREVVQVYEQNVDSVSDRMVDRFVSYRKRWLTHRTFDAVEQEEYRADMTQFQLQRQRLAQDAIERLRTTLTSEQWAELEQVAQKYQKKATAHVSQQHGLDFTP
jgi:hypothetical protein